jgi:ABC-type dipeptide/oligopeptide/nickel transport system permease component
VAEEDTDVLKYSTYRLCQLIPVLLLVSIVVFAMVHLLPGDVIDALAGEAEAHDPAVRAALEKELGLDQPIYVQYFMWLGKIVLHGDFGKSITTRRSIGVSVSPSRHWRGAPLGSSGPSRTPRGDCGGIVWPAWGRR